MNRSCRQLRRVLGAAVDLAVVALDVRVEKGGDPEGLRQHGAVGVCGVDVAAIPVEPGVRGTSLAPPVDGVIAVGGVMLEFGILLDEGCATPSRRSPLRGCRSNRLLV